MKQLELRIVPQSRLLLGTESGNTNFIDSADAIPGSMVRGLVGSRLYAALPAEHSPTTCSDPACLFCAIFRDERIYFGTARYRRDRSQSWPVPRTAQSCKQYPGFFNQRPRADGVFDMLCADLAWQLTSDPDAFGNSVTWDRLPVTPASSWQAQRRALDLRHEIGLCPVCQTRLTAIKRQGSSYLYRRNQQQAHIATAPLPPVERCTHVGINRARMVAEDSLLYTETALDFSAEGGLREFAAQVSVPEQFEAALLQACRMEGYLGRGRSRGNGAVKLRARAQTREYPTVAERMKNLQQMWIQAIRRYQPKFNDTTGQIVTVTLRSHAILTAHGVPVRVPSPQQLGLPAETVTLRGWATHTVIGGWDSAIQMRRRTQQAVTQGSVFAYYVPDAPATLVDTLQTLEQNGIGRERGSGYGELTVCADFHVQQARF